MEVKLHAESTFDDRLEEKFKRAVDPMVTDFTHHVTEGS